MNCEHYREQAQNNEKAANSIKSDYPDWAVTMCFYAALHWVEYYACVKNFDIRNEYPEEASPHESRRKYVFDLAKELGNKKLHKLYEDLENESQKARYLKLLTTNAKTYYATNKLKVTQSFQNLQQIRVILSS